MITASANGSILNRAVLVLNTNYAPLDICNAKRAICLYFMEKVDILESYQEMVHSPSLELTLPSIIKLKGFVKFNSLNVALSRKNILLRDKYQCQYCGNKFGSLSLDHVIPKERGGGDNWDNLVTACQPCNRKKGNRTPEEAEMKLNRIPRKPNRIHYFQNFINEEQGAWRPYLFLDNF
ncbi:MAG: HNH endonuclease [Candidatus Neomarinimicrobiota bacterium]